MDPEQLERSTARRVRLKGFRQNGMAERDQLIPDVEALVWVVSQLAPK
ncbi:hypothetical protein [Streptomyces sp. NBC_01104]|nr:hypothetical protein OG450_00865 [Streptomyces sp. NBC_01104]